MALRFVRFLWFTYVFILYQNSESQHVTFILLNVSCCLCAVNSNPRIISSFTHCPTSLIKSVFPYPLCESYLLILFLWAAASHFAVISLISAGIKVDTSPSGCVGFLSSQNLPIRVTEDMLNKFYFLFSMPLNLYRFTMWICIHKGENRDLKRIPQLPDQKSGIKIWYSSSLKK